MKTLRKLFFGLNITWPKLLISAGIAGVVTGIIMMIPFLEGTSIQNIGITFEAWILFAMIICTNSKKPLEAACKTIVFFLISQPLVYLTMWPVYGHFPWYYYIYWFYFTLATFPMALLAWYIRKQNIGSMLIVTVVCTFLLMLAAYDLRPMIAHFPFGLLAILFCIAQAIVYFVLLIDSKKLRIISIVLSFAIAIAFAIVSFAPSSSTGMEFEGAQDYRFTVADEGIVTVSTEIEDFLDITARGYGSTVITGVKPDGTTVTFNVTVNLDGLIDVHQIS